MKITSKVGEEATALIVLIILNNYLLTGIEMQRSKHFKIHAQSLQKMPNAISVQIRSSYFKQRWYYAKM